MKRIGILTAGGDTPALNATIHGAVARANQLRIEVIGFIKGFSSLFNPRVPHVHLNPLFSSIPELDPVRGGTLLGASRDYVDADDKNAIDTIGFRLKRLGVDGLLCVGGDGTLNGMQAISECLPTVLAPKTIDNDLGLNYRNEPNEWRRGEAVTGPIPPIPGAVDLGGFWYTRSPGPASFDLQRMVNYATPGYATAVYVSATGVQRIRTTAESHRRIAIVEVMGRHSGYIALGSMYGQPDLLLVPESRVNVDMLVERVKEIYDLQKHAVIVCGEGIIDENGQELGAEHASTDPAGNKILSGASESLRELLIRRLGDNYFTSKRRNESARAAIFTRKIGHTQRGGRPILFDRFYAAQLGGHAVDLLLAGRINAVSILQYTEEKGFHLGEVFANDFRDQWGHIHARKMHPAFYDPIALRPSALGIQYLLPIFTNAIGQDDLEALRTDLFDESHLALPYHSVNTDINKRIKYLPTAADGHPPGQE
ncbi:MAG: 6-phosphofructokinase [Fimbriiglobus sp.]|jgi:6-phosphofructokinase 1|nr:6-phosphofructokinase [Fimbriiglobus sp.]